MIKNFYGKLSLKLITFAILLVGVMLRFGLLYEPYRTDMWVFYTNISNYICFILIIIDLIFFFKKKESNLFNVFLLLSAVWILITMLVYNILLEPKFYEVDYWTSLGNLTFHLFGPLFFILNVIFCTGKMKLSYKIVPLFVSFPYVYVIYILIRGAILPADFTGTRYPYSFLNVDKLGYGGVALWVLGLTAIFVGLGSLFIYLKKRK